MSFLDVVKDFAGYIKQNKKYWLIPALLALLITGFLIATAGTTSVPVFVYPVV